MAIPAAPTSARRCRTALPAAASVSPPRSGSAASAAVCRTSYVARCIAVAIPRRARSRTTAKTAAASAAEHSDNRDHGPELRSHIAILTG